MSPFRQLGGQLKICFFFIFHKNFLANYVENSLLKSEVTDTSHSVYLIENGNIEPELKINVTSDLKKTVFDIRSLKEEGDHFQGKF